MGIKNRNQVSTHELPQPHLTPNIKGDPKAGLWDTTEILIPITWPSDHFLMSMIKLLFKYQAPEV